MSRIISRLLLSLLLLAAPLAARADLSRLAFMQGYWKADFGGGEATEVWLPAEGGTITGMFRLVTADGHSVIEFMVIEQDGEDVVMRWNHFNADYTRWEAEPIEHYLREVSAGHAVFELAAPQDKLPTHLIFTRSGDELRVWVGDRNAADQSGAFELKYRRAAKDPG